MESSAALGPIAKTFLSGILLAIAQTFLRMTVASTFIESSASVQDNFRKSLLQKMENILQISLLEATVSRHNQNNIYLLF